MFAVFISYLTGYITFFYRSFFCQQNFFRQYYYIFIFCNRSVGYQIDMTF